VFIAPKLRLLLQFRAQIIWWINFIWKRLAAFPDVKQVMRAEFLEIESRASEALEEGTSALCIGVVVILPIILPQTDWANFICASLVESSKSATWAGVFSFSCRSRDIHEHLFNSP
jgi:hypothetical protein